MTTRECDVGYEGLRGMAKGRASGWPQGGRGGHERRAPAAPRNLHQNPVRFVPGSKFITGHEVLGGIQAFIQFSRLFTQPVGQIGGILDVIQPRAASARRVFDLLDAAEIPAEPC